MKALIIDDSPTVCSVMEYLLKHEGWECQFATSAKDGIEVLDSQGSEIDLIIVDHTLNHIDGLSVIEEYKKHGHKNKSILLSQDDRYSVIHKAQDLGADCWLHKPVSMENMVQALQYALK